MSEWQQCNKELHTHVTDTHTQEPRLLDEDTVTSIVERAEQLFKKEPNVLTLSAPTVVSPHQLVHSLQLHVSL